MPLNKVYTKRGSYYTKNRTPSKVTEKRLSIPQPPVRPVRFQIRSIIRDKLLKQSPWWYIEHRRGPYQKQVGLDPLEARAVPTSEVRGTLPERIIYKSLRDDFHLVSGVDFKYQSSLQGGRLDTGGIVADFLFPYLRIILNPMGPTHYEVLRMYKDTEQVMALAELGYTVYFIDENDVYDEAYFTNWMKRVVGKMNVYESQNNEVVDDLYNVRQVSTLLEDYAYALRLEAL